MSARYRILICDDHKHARKAMQLILSSDPSFEIIGEATNGREAIQLTQEMQPDVILMDINMPTLNGHHTTKVIKDRFPQVKIVMVTVSDDALDLFEALKKGAQGYLLKNLNTDIWIEYLHSLMEDDESMSPEVAHRIIQGFHQTSEHKSVSSLTQREQEVLCLVVKGWSNKEIASTLTISEYTVKNHLKNIMQKLQLKNRVQLTRYAYEQGLV
ncbi:two component transcriptional regulator, LuxR family [Seinonella peptonophila]|uniref:Two component transcriptional regulator, LuxR family n=1 Tax=Seinonella peptonophila TaxID=112248 RepID=A0A1M4U768_9BACL|nr:response regulator transcription factor [Seinonella peptonophila]SHE52430.1 two component transcriptional regulator, LuxR family [Seinonella peptonophila]